MQISGRFQVGRTSSSKVLMGEEERKQKNSQEANAVAAES